MRFTIGNFLYHFIGLVGMRSEDKLPREKKQKEQIKYLPCNLQSYIGEKSYMHVQVAINYKNVNMPMIKGWKKTK